jgi:hypothetical protein
VGALAPPIVGLVRPLHKKRAILGAEWAEVKATSIHTGARSR